MVSVSRRSGGGGLSSGGSLMMNSKSLLLFIGGCIGWVLRDTSTWGTTSSDGFDIPLQNQVLERMILQQQQQQQTQPGSTRCDDGEDGSGGGGGGGTTATTTTTTTWATLAEPTMRKIPSERQKQFETLTTIQLEGLELCHDTAGRGWEVIFAGLMGGLFREPGIIPEGAVMDVGAQYGEQSCHYASIAPHRQIYTLDPSPRNQRVTNESYGIHVPNMNLMQVGIGKELGKMRARDASFNMRGYFDVVTMDSLFYERNIKLAFAHIDVEGLEYETLQGGTQTILHHRPIFTTELRVHKDHKYTIALLNYITETLGYDSYVINEVCGAPYMDYRNLLNIPREMSPKLVHSDVFAFALATEVLFRVDATTIKQMVYPCCAPFAECCPTGETTNRRSGCCSEGAVSAYMKEHPNEFMSPAAYHGWNRARKLTMDRWAELSKRTWNDGNTTRN